jgi:hypothetical protein
MSKTLSNFVIIHDESMVSFDDVALFPSLDFVLEYMNDKLTTIHLEDQKRSAFLEVAFNCMKQNFFLFQNKFYQQTTGTSKGNPLSPLIANIFMSRFELDLAEKQLLPRIWYGSWRILRWKILRRNILRQKILRWRILRLGFFFGWAENSSSENSSLGTFFTGSFFA